MYPEKKYVDGGKRKTKKRKSKSKKGGDQLSQDMALEAQMTPQCQLQKAMHRDPIGIKFLAKLEHHLQEGTNPDALGIIFGDMNFNAEMVNDGLYDHKYAVSIWGEK